MTQPDKWNEIAIQLWCKPKHSRKTVDADLAVDIATALRSAYQEGEKAGMERAIAKIHWLWNADGTKGERRVAVETIAAIRAAKETKE